MQGWRRRLLQEVEHGPHVVEGSGWQIVVQFDGEGRASVIVDARVVTKASQHGGKIIVMVRSNTVLEDGHADEVGSVCCYLFGVGGAVEDVIDGYEGG